MFFASWKRAGPDLRLLWAAGLVGLWFAFGAHLGASQILYEVPGFNNFRRRTPRLHNVSVAFLIFAQDKLSCGSNRRKNLPVTGNKVLVTRQPRLYGFGFFDTVGQFASPFLM